MDVFGYLLDIQLGYLIYVYLCVLCGELPLHDLLTIVALQRYHPMGQSISSAANTAISRGLCIE